MDELLPQRIISLDDTEYILVNAVQKTDGDQVIIHLINYLNNVKNLRIRVNLEGIVKNIDVGKVRIYSPDDGPERLKEVVVNDKQVAFVLSELKIYDMIVIN